MGPWVYLNDDFVSAGEACLHVSDLSIQRGYGIFDFIKVLQSTPIFLDDHLDRFYRSASAMHLPLTQDKEALKEIVQEVAFRNMLNVSGIRLTLTGGYSADGYLMGTPNLIITQSSFTEPTDEVRQKGIYLFTKTHQRQLAHVKTIDYLMPIWLQNEVKEKGADDVLYTMNDIITECPRANIFIVTKEGILITPSKNILQGITRNKILELAKLFCAVEKREVSMADLSEASAVFITSTTKGVLPVRQIDGFTYSTNNKISNHLNTELKLINTNLSSTERVLHPAPILPPE